MREQKPREQQARDTSTPSVWKAKRGPSRRYPKQTYHCCFHRYGPISCHVSTPGVSLPRPLGPVPLLGARQSAVDHAVPRVAGLRTVVRPTRQAVSHRYVSAYSAPREKGRAVTANKSWISCQRTDTSNEDFRARFPFSPRAVPLTCYIC